MANNLKEFSRASGFQKLVLSILASLKVQQEELNDLRNIFLTLDVNKDGSLSHDELNSGLKNLVCFELFQDHEKGQEDCVRDVMNRCDLDGDGRIDYQEFIQAAINHRAMLNKENIKIAFNIFDENADGKISCSELNKIFSDKVNVNNSA